MENKRKRPNLQIIGLHEGENFQINSIDQIIKKIIEENFP